MFKTHSTKRLIRSEHLNHHGTLFAGIGAQWFVEASYIAVASELDPHRLVCKQISTLNFMNLVKIGEIVDFCSTISKVGVTSLTVKTTVRKNGCEAILVEGEAVFVHVDENTVPIPHNLKNQ